MPSVAGVAIDSDMGGPANNYQKRGVGLITAGQLVSQYKDLAKSFTNHLEKLQKY